MVNGYFIENPQKATIAELFAEQPMPRHWLEREFARTGLPKSALANYLGVDNAAISRTIHGERQLSPGEIDLAHAFFSIVPEDAPESHTDAIRRLRSTKIRDAVGLVLSRWLLERLAPNDFTSHDLFGAVASLKATLRVDQIVGLCRMFEIDVFGLVQGYGVRSRRWEVHGSRELLVELKREASRWSRQGTIPYQFDRSPEAPSPRASASKKKFVTLQPAHPTSDDLSSYVAYLIPDDSGAPRFEQGQTIFLDVHSEPRNGDYVAALVRDQNSDDARAVLGRLLYVSRDQIGIEAPRSNRTEVLRRDVADLRRIAFCKM